MPVLSRRAGLLGLTAAFTIGRTAIALADAPTDRRLIVINLRGALDGLAAVVPYGDPALAPMRAPLMPPPVGQPDGMLDLGGFFGLHPLLIRLHAMFQAGEAAILHAITGPWRERSHFIAQDMLESGAGQRMTSGWLNRAIAAIPAPAIPASTRTAMAIGTGVPLLLRGQASVENWAPSNLATPHADLYAAIARLNQDDAATGPAIQTGLRVRGFSKEVLATADRSSQRMEFPALARTTGTLLAAANGPRIAALEIGGWDTHAAQVARLAGPLGRLDEGLGALKEALGSHWRNTAVLVMTEFGRTARVNGTEGTDHGTATVALVLGGAVKGGRVIADWPGLANDRLFEGRDLMPTRDLRSVAMGLITSHLGVPATQLASVFPASAGLSPMLGLV